MKYIQITLWHCWDPKVDLLCANPRVHHSPAYQYRVCKASRVELSANNAHNKNKSLRNKCVFCYTRGKSEWEVVNYLRIDLARLCFGIHVTARWAGPPRIIALIGGFQSRWEWEMGGMVRDMHLHLLGN